MGDQTTNSRSTDKVCDIVMKGGITSGVVYPPAIIELAQLYRFRKIGGTSAGAIAACITAVAELKREAGTFDQSSRRDDTLEALASKLKQPRFLRSLFQPSRGIGPLMNTLLFLIAGANNRRTRSRADAALGKIATVIRFQSVVIRYGLLPFLVGLLAVVVGRYAQHAGLVPPAPWWLATVFFGWLVGLALWLVYMLFILLVRVPRNFYGMCTGLTQPGRKSPALTDWMLDNFSRLTGRGAGYRSLTFKDLAAHQVGDQQHPITLQMVATDLSHNQPYVVPFRVNGFLFKEDEMQRFFPEDVVRQMRECTEQLQEVVPVALDGTAVAETVRVSFAELNKELGPGRRFFLLPSGDQLPIIVGMRLSLSFPILFSAVPLWTISAAVFDEHRGEERYTLTNQDINRYLQRHLFSDGGISSNFPIHFFDAWLPSCPTFGINLTPFPRQAVARTPAEMLRHPLRSLAAARRSAETASLEIPQHLSVLQVGFEAAVPARTPPAAPAQDALVAKRAEQLANDVFLPSAFTEVFPPWRRVDSLVGFIGAMLSTMQNYRDTAQAMLPGYRERIVHIRLDAGRGEGGLNLDMPVKVIASIERKGQLAGQKLRQDFNWQHHQWVRFRVLLAELEPRLAHLRDVLAAAAPETLASSPPEGEATSAPRSNAVAGITADTAPVRPYRDLLSAIVDTQYPFPAFADEQADEWRKQALERLDALTAVLNGWGDEETAFFSKQPPLPKSVLRVTPDL